jgi:carboxyl-terminal processing protease
LQAFVNVITIGGSSCGKPYGMFQANNCANAYFAIEFEGKNAAGQGGYVNGFAPTCPVADDLEHQLGDVNGDVNERVLQTALGYQSTGACPAVAMTQASAARPAAQPAAELYRAPWRNNRILTRP